MLAPVKGAYLWEKSKKHLKYSKYTVAPTENELNIIINEHVFYEFCELDKLEKV